MFYSCSFGQVVDWTFEEIKQLLLIPSYEIFPVENMRQILPLPGFGRIKYLWVSSVVMAQLVEPSLLTPKIKAQTQRRQSFIYQL